MQGDKPWWLEACAAAGEIRDYFGEPVGLEKAISYLVGEKLVLFLRLCQDDPKLGADLPAFIACIKQLFTDQEIADYLKQMPRRRTFGSGPIDRTLLREALLP
jgi:hypothetical protein